ncbi:MAG: PAS domain S-box protein [Desulfatibacillaceae bacterium]
MSYREDVPERGQARDRDKTREQLLSELEELREEVLAQRRLADAALRLERSQLEESSPHGGGRPADLYLVLFTDDRLVVRAARGSLQEYLGKTRREVMGRKLLAALDMDTADRVLLEKDLEGALGGENGPCRHFTLYTPAGESRLHEGLVLSSPAPDGGVALVLRDMSHYRYLLRALKETESRYDDLVEKAPVGIAVHDLRDGKFLQVNELMCKMSGYTEEELLGMTVSDFIIRAEQLEEHHHRMSSTMEGDWVPLHVEYLVRAKSGEERWADVRVYLIHEGGVPVKSKCVITDITERKWREEENRRLEQQLRQARKLEAMGTLAGGVAHDFNNILGAILGHTELAYHFADDPRKVRDSLDEVRIASNRARQLIRQILAFSRQSDGRTRPVRLDLIVREGLSLLRAAMPSTVELASDLKCESFIMADATQIHQVLINLCTNARYAVGSAPGVIQVTVHEETLFGELAVVGGKVASGRYLCLTVRDNGRGIEEQHLHRVFDPYFTTKPAGSGSGLGLSVVHGIVVNHCGGILLDSAPGKGTTVRAYFPATEETPVVVEDRKRPLPKGSGHLLLVDDEPQLVKSNRQLLEIQGYTVTCCHDPRHALALLEKQPMLFDCLVTDQTMPHMTGLDLGAEAQGIRPGLPMVLLTGFGKDLDREAARAAGVHTVLDKPVKSDDLAHAVREAMASVEE